VDPTSAHYMRHGTNMAPMKRTTDVDGQVSQSTRERILSAAREVFRENGYFHSRVEDIIQRCGVSRGTFYYYFRNKRHVFEELVTAAVDELFQEAGRRADGNDPYSRIESGNRGFLTVWVKHADVLRNLFQVSMIDERFSDMHQRMRMQFILRIRRRLAQEVVRGRCRRMNPDVVACALGAMMDWFAFLWLGSGAFEFPEVDFEEVVKELSNLWYRGVYG